VIADIGAGTGALLGPIGSVAPAARVVALDASTRMLRIARTRRRRVGRPGRRARPAARRRDRRRPVPAHEIRASIRLANMARIAQIPATLIHGLHDVSGPLDTACELHKAWPASRLVVVDDAGHFGGSMGEQVTAAIDAMADQLHPA
jgi:pimeloyl-ACP methyl ester carboxylesterase